MSTAVADLIIVLKIDYGQTLEDAVARRAILRAIIFLNSDLGTKYQVSGTEPDEIIDPDLLGIYQELVLLRAQAFLTRITRTTFASSLTVKSGDKSISRSSTGWQNLERDLLNDYWRKIAQLDPDKAEGVLVVTDSPEIYKQGSEIEEAELIKYE